MSTTVTQDLPGGWTATLTYSPGITGPVEVLVRPTDPDDPPTAGLSSTVLRDVSFAEAARELSSSATETVEVPADALRNAKAHAVDETYLSLLAAAAMAQGSPRQAQDALSKTLGVSASTVRNHLWQARRKGLVQDTHDRRGSLTDEALRLINKALAGEQYASGYRDHRG